jgi:hypothetical protein
MKLLLILFTLLIGSIAHADDDDVIRTDTNSTVTSNGSMETTINSPPPSAISPNLTTGTGDLCTISASASIQTQILGLSAGKVFTEKNCVRLKNAKTLYDMGLKVAAISVMCEEESGIIRKSLKNAGTPCPHAGLIGDAALIAYELENKVAEEESNGTLKRLFNSENDTKIGIGTVFGSLLFLFLL